MKNFIKRYPVSSYYLLVFAISWGGILILIGGPDHIPGTKEQAEKLFVPALLIMFAGPFISGILMNFLIDGKEGLRKLLSRFLRWRTKGRWYAIAVFTGPILVVTVLYGLSLFNQDFLPGIGDRRGLLVDPPLSVNPAVEMTGVFLAGVVAVAGTPGAVWALLDARP